MKFIGKIIGLLLLLTFLALTGCTQPSKSQPPAAPGPEQVQIDPALGERVKEAAKVVKGVRESTAVVVNDEISVAVKVQGFDRLRLKPIRKEVHNQVKQLAPEHEIHVTSDKKLFSLLQRIEQQMGSLAPGEIKSRVDKINQDMRG